MARAYHAWIQSIDILVVLTTSLGVWWVCAPAILLSDYLVLTLSVALSIVPVGLLLGLYTSFRAMSSLSWIKKVTTAWSLLASFLFLVVWSIDKGEAFNQLWIFVWLLSAWLVSVFWRLVASMVFRHLRALGYNHKHIVIVGAGRLGQEIYTQITSSPWSGFEVAAFFDDHPDKVGTWIGKTSIYDADGLDAWLTDHCVDEIWFALPLRAEPRLQQLLHQLRHTTANIRYVPNLSGLRLLNHAPREVLGFSMLDLSVSPMTEPMNRVVKSVEDKVIAGLILLLISPVMLVLALGVKLTSPGPVFYRQKRVGLNGEVFEMFKFRSMSVDVEKEGVQWGSAATKTNTCFGAFIRKTSLDELPQFINVLKGDMSIVGPRPERPMFVEQFKDEIPGYMQKHMVKAGITGWAQVHGWRGDTCLKTRIEYDLWYIEHWSLWLDIKIIMMTLFKGFVHKNAQ